MTSHNVKRYSQKPIETPRQDFSQFGERLVASTRTKLHLESENGILALRDTLSQIDGSALSTATGGEAGGEIKLSSGTDATESIKLETNQVGEYASSREAQCALYFRRSQKPTQSQVVRWGYFNSDDGLFFQEDANGTSIVVRKDGTDRSLDSISSDAIFNGPLAISDIPRNEGRIYTINFAWYGIGKCIFAVETSQSIDPRAEVAKDQIFRVYDAQRDPALPDGTSGQYMNTPNLPIRVEIENDPNQSTPPDSNLDVFVGGRQFSTMGESAPNRRFQQDSFTATVGTSRVPIFALRPRETYNGRENSINTRIGTVMASTDGNVTLDAEINGAVSDSFNIPGNYTQTTTSVETVDYEDGGTALTESTSGIPTQPVLFLRSNIFSLPANRDNEIDQPLGVEQQFVVYAQADSSGTEVDVAIEWTESF